MTDETGFAPTHVTPPGGVRTWASADTSQPGPTIDAGIEVQLAERSGDWSRVICSNGWQAWVDGRLLVDVEATRSLATALLARLGAAVKECEQVVDDAAAQRIDEAEFRRRVFQAGMIVSQDEVWFLDLPNARWCRYDGFGVTMLGTNEG